MPWNYQLHGADYLSNTLFAPGIFGTPDPSVVFPMLRNLGFNLVRVPISWRVLESNPSAYQSELIALASQADANGISVIYDFHAGSDWNSKEAFPTALYGAYSSVDAFYNAWWPNQAPYDGMSGWDAILNSFWSVVIATVDSYSSTIGYEIMNEPPLSSSTTTAQMKQHNQYIANWMRAHTSKSIVFMNAYTSPGQGDLDPSATPSVAPTGVSNLVLDFHDYTDTSTVQPYASVAQSIGLAGVVLGEYNSVYDNSGTNTVVQTSYFDSVFGAVKQYNVASCCWAIQCSDFTLALLNNDCTESVELQSLSTEANNILGTSPPPTQLTFTIHAIDNSTQGNIVGASIVYANQSPVLTNSNGLASITTTINSGTLTVTASGYQNVNETLTPVNGTQYGVNMTPITLPPPPPVTTNSTLTIASIVIIVILGIFFLR